MSLLSAIGMLGGGIQGGYSVLEAQRKKAEQDALADETKKERQRVIAERIATRKAQHGMFDQNRGSAATEASGDLSGAADMIGSMPTITGGIPGLPFAMKAAAQKVEDSGRQASDFDPNVDYGELLSEQDRQQQMADRRRGTMATNDLNRTYKDAQIQATKDRIAETERMNNDRLRASTDLQTRGAAARRLLGPQGEGLTDQAAVEALADRMTGRYARVGTGGSTTDPMERLIPRLQAKASFSEKLVPKGDWRPDAALPQDPTSKKGMNIAGLPFNKGAFDAATADSTAKAHTAQQDQGNLARAIDLSIQHADPSFVVPESPQGSMMAPGGAMEGQGMEAELSQVDQALKAGPPTPERVTRANNLKAQIRAKYGQPGAPTTNILDTAMQMRKGTYVPAKPKRPSLGGGGVRLMGDG